MKILHLNKKIGKTENFVKAADKNVMPNILLNYQNILEHYHIALLLHLQSQKFFIYKLKKKKEFVYF